MNECKADGCTRLGNKKKWGLCESHRYRREKYGDMYADLHHVMHGMNTTAEYHAWQYMKARCLNPNNTKYKDYGGRGITIYQPWIKHFSMFYQHIGKKPSSEYSLDRIDVDGNYEPGNVRWADKTTQSLNRRPYGKHRGVYKLSNCDLWEAGLSIKRQRVYRQRFKTEAEAVAGRLAAELKYLGYNL